VVLHPDPVRVSALDSNDPEQIPLYCINLEYSTDRRERVTRRFVAHGIFDRVRFISAIGTASPLLDAHLEHFGHPEPDAKRRADWAIVLSHLRAIRTFVEETPESASSAIVFEDDVLLHREWHSRLPQILANLPTTARVCALGYTPASGFNSDWLGIDPLKRNLIPMVPGRAWGSFGYWISRGFAEAILDDFEEMAKRSKLVAERLMWRSDGFIAQPPLVLEEGLPSTRPDVDITNHKLPHRAWGVQNYVVVEEDSRLFDLDPDRPPQSICLCMIVRNEGDVIERLAESVRGIINSWVICDTGSTDGTPERVREAFADIPGQLFFDEWQNFGANRTLMLERARDRADYLLLLEAYQTLHIRGELPHLEADAYALLVDQPMAGPIPRLVKADLPWRFVGAAREFLTCDEQVTEAVCPMIVVEHHGDDTNRPDKLARDRALLEKDFAKDPTNPHTVFHLAHTYQDLGEDQLAIDFYTRRMHLGGAAEEVFYAMYSRAELVARTNWDLGMMLLLQAWEYRPTRVEPLYALLHGLRVRSQFHLGAMIGDWARKVRAPKDDLFVHEDLYAWMVEFEFSICVLRIGDYKRALAVNERLLQKGLPDDVREYVAQNREACLVALGR